jgi:outer membrane protein assembly factor BamB
VTDGKHLIVSFGSRGLYCYDLAGGLVWKKDLGKLFTRKSFGEGSSPALHGDTVVLVRDHEEEDVLLAFDKKDGRELWRTRRDEPTAWSTPLIVEHAGRAQVLVAAASGLRGYDLQDGRELWSGPALTICAGHLQASCPEPALIGFTAMQDGRQFFHADNLIVPE